MNKLLQQMTSRFHTIDSANQDTFGHTPSMIDLNIKVDSQTWSYFQDLDEDARSMMARVLKDYVEKQK